MKKTLLINMLVAVLFFLFEPLLNFCNEWADTYNLGAEMVLGMMTPVLFVLFVLITLSSIVYSCYKCFTKKDVKHLIPIFVFVIGAIIYALNSNSDSLWIRLINYY